MATSALTQKSSNKVFGGTLRRFTHESQVLGCSMTFAVYFPPEYTESSTPCPTLYWLSGLTCTDENFSQKSGAQRAAAKHNIVLVIPDTSPRGLNIPGESDVYSFGVGAGFYLNATQDPWAKNWKMYDYITKELPELVKSNFNVSGDKSISGHSMGGHGALVIGLKNPSEYKSISAFAPISNPVNCPWGKQAFTGYLGSDESTWKEWDSSELLKTYNGPQLNILVDQGTEDNFFKDGQLLPQALVDASKASGQQVTLRYQEGYDHSYYFISTFIDEHIAFHASFLRTNK